MSEFEILTYREIAERLGISAESARKKVRRRKWHVVPGNRPSDPVRVHVPTEVLLSERNPAADIDDEPVRAAPSELLSTLKALEGYVARVSGHQDRLLAELGKLLQELAAKDAAHAADMERMRGEERDRYEGELEMLRTEYKQGRAERLEEINRLVADIERERTGRKEETEHYRAELDRQWQNFLEERERYFEDLERERMATAKAEARAYRSEAAATELRSALVTVVPRLETLLRPSPAKPAEPPAQPPETAARRPPEDDIPPLPPALVARSRFIAPAARDDDDQDGEDGGNGGGRKRWWPFRRR